MTEDEQRALLVAIARDLRGVRFPTAGTSQAMLNFESSRSGQPATLSCSQFVRCVVDRAFGDGFWSTLVGEDYVGVAQDGGAKTMARVLELVEEPQRGDLHFFSNKEGTDDWHVMMVVDDGKLIGACPGEAVLEVSAGYFSEMTDQGPRGIRLPTAEASLELLL